MYTPAGLSLVSCPDSGPVDLVGGVRGMINEVRPGYVYPALVSRHPGCHQLLTNMADVLPGGRHAYYYPLYKYRNLFSKSEKKCISPLPHLLTLEA